MFDLSASKTSSERIAPWLPTALGVAAAAGVAWLMRPKPAPDSLSWPGIAVLSIGYVLLCAIAGATATWAAAAFLDRSGDTSVDSRALNLGTSIVMVWLAPLMLFLFHKSPAACLAAILVGWLLAKSIPLRDAFPPDNPFHSTELFQTLRAMDAIPHVPGVVALCSVICLYLGLSMIFLGRPIFAAALLGTASLLVASSSNTFRLRQDHQPRTFAKPASILLTCAILFTAAGLLRYLHLGNSDEAAANEGMTTEVAAKKAIGVVDGDYLGVILLTEPRSKEVLLPPRSILKREPLSTTQQEPLSVPFFGVYWMFRWPNTQPPSGSFTKTETPLEQNFFVTDRRPLRMEARQNFGNHIDLRDYSQIQLSLRSADGPTSLELIVADTAFPEGRSMSLGYGTIPSTLTGRGPNASPIPMTATFNVPANPTLVQFDEATIVFNRAFATAAAKVAIDRFIFVPRGR